MAADSDSEFLDATQTTMSDVGDAQLTQLQEQLVATMIENENISWSSLCIQHISCKQLFCCIHWQNTVTHFWPLFHWPSFVCSLLIKVDPAKGLGKHLGITTIGFVTGWIPFLVLSKC